MLIALYHTHMLLSINVAHERADQLQSYTDLVQTVFAFMLGCFLQDFRGRDPSTEALLRHNNLLPAAA